MLSYVLICIVAATALLIMWKVLNKREKKLLYKLEDMIGSAREGNFDVTQIDETMLSSVENSMSRFLDDCSVSEKNLKEQKDKIQTLISDISHQTVTPISNILLYSQLLEEKMTNDPGEQTQIVAIREQAEKLSFLIESLVKTSRLETGIIKTVNTRVEMHELLTRVIDSVKTKADKKGISISFENAIPIYACCDKKWTTEALFNILDNAVKYTENGGQIKAELTEYSMFCRIDISDNGVGIAEDELPKIFGRFYRSERTSDEQGIGLGLYLVREIIENEGGYVKVSSTPGIGTKFSVFLNVSTL